MGDTSKILLSAKPRKKGGRGPKLREASFKDYEQIALLESRYLKASSYERWIHFWEGNPVYRELQPGWSIGWVLEDENGQIVGSMGNIPLLYELQGRRILTASGCSWVAEPAYRSASLLLLDHVINQRNVDLYLNSTVSAESLAAVSAFECPSVPVGVWDEWAFWVTNYQGFFESIASMRNYRLVKPLSFPLPGKPPWTRGRCIRCRLARPLSYPLSAAAFLKDRLTKEPLREGDVEVKAYPAFDDRFDTFWEDLKRSNPHLLLAVRTREVLEWHFKHALLDNRLWIVTVVDGPRLAAYAIFERRDDPKSNFKRVQLVDFQSLDGSTALLSPLLSWALRKCRAEGIHMLEHTGRWLEKGEFIDTHAPYRRKLAAWAYFYRANNPELREILRDQDAWAPSFFDGDASL